MRTIVVSSFTHVIIIVNNNNNLLYWKKNFFFYIFINIPIYKFLVYEYMIGNA